MHDHWHSARCLALFCLVLVGPWGMAATAFASDMETVYWDNEHQAWMPQGTQPTEGYLDDRQGPSGDCEWSATDDMNSTRRGHTATLLPNGTVLVVGGPFTRAAEIYDPTTGTFSPAGSTTVLHGQGFSATLLPSGKVLLVGGTGSANTVAELYDPATGLFELTGSLMARHSHHTATLLNNGLVLIAGGQDTDAGPQSQGISELYDPETGLFTLTESLNEDRSGHVAALLPSGEVLIAGGVQTTTPGHGICLDSAEIFDPATEEFRIVADRTDSVRCGHGAASLNDGDVLIVGGLSYPAGETFDHDTETFEATAPLNTLSSSGTATLLQNGEVLLTGGFVAVGPVVTNAVEIYDPVSRSFLLAPSMITARQQHTATLLPSGDVVVIGGFSGVADTALAEVYGCPAGVTLDIRPGSCPNPLNRRSHGVLTAALVGTADFDPALIDLTTVLIARGDGVGSQLAPHEGPPGPHSTIEDVATPFGGAACDCHDLEGDGINDLRLVFKTDDLVTALELSDLLPGDSVELVVTGELVDGTPFEARDCVVLVPRGSPPGLLSVDAGPATIWVELDLPDTQFDGGGFGSFSRTYGQGEIVTLAAPAASQGTPFRAWIVDGVVQPVGQRVLNIEIHGDVTTVQAAYDYLSLGPSLERITTMDQVLGSP